LRKIVLSRASPQASILVRYCACPAVDDLPLLRERHIDARPILRVCYLDSLRHSVVILAAMLYDFKPKGGSIERLVLRAICRCQALEPPNEFHKGLPPNVWVGNKWQTGDWFRWQHRHIDWKRRRTCWIALRSGNSVKLPPRMCEPFATFIEKRTATKFPIAG